jgi:hypothetical protein
MSESLERDCFKVIRTLAEIIMAAINVNSKIVSGAEAVNHIKILLLMI